MCVCVCVRVCFCVCVCVCVTSLDIDYRHIKILLHTDPPFLFVSLINTLWSFDPIYRDTCSSKHSRRFVAKLSIKDIIEASGKKPQFHSFIPRKNLNLGEKTQLLRPLPLVKVSFQKVSESLYFPKFRTKESQIGCVTKLPMR